MCGGGAVKELECQAEKLDLDLEVKGNKSGIRAGEAHVEGWELNAGMEEGWWVVLGGQEGSG